MFRIGEGKCKSAELSIVIIRADGSKHDLGVVSYYHSNPIKRGFWVIRNWISRHF